MAVDIMNAAAASGLDGSVLYKRIRSYFDGGGADWSFGEGSKALANELYGGFSDYLEETYPSLSQSEIRMCCLLVLGANQSCISLSCGYEHHVTFYNKRTKIRRKMGLDSSESFEEHLSRLAASLHDWNLSRLNQ